MLFKKKANKQKKRQKNSQKGKQDQGEVHKEVHQIPYKNNDIIFKLNLFKRIFKFFRN